MRQLRPAPAYLNEIMFPVLATKLQIPVIPVGGQRYSRSKQISNPEIQGNRVITQAQMVEMLQKHPPKVKTNRLRRGLLTNPRQSPSCELKAVVENRGAKLHRRIRRIYLMPLALGLTPHPTMTSHLLR